MRAMADVLRGHRPMLFFGCGLSLRTLRSKAFLCSRNDLKPENPQRKAASPQTKPALKYKASSCSLAANGKTGARTGFTLFRRRPTALLDPLALRQVITERREDHAVESVRFPTCSRPSLAI